MEIGAHVYEGYAVYGTGTGNGQSAIGNAPPASGNPLGYQAYTGSAVVQWPAVPSMGALTRTGNIFTDTSFPSGTPSKVIRCTDASISPSDTNIFFRLG